MFNWFKRKSEKKIDVHIYTKQVNDTCISPHDKYQEKDIQKFPAKHFFQVPPGILNYQALNGKIYQVD